MGDIQKRIEIKKATRKRVKHIGFGDKITNVCAGKNNPMRHCYFVRYKSTSHIVECTDKKGNFGDYGADVIYQGHLSYGESKELYNPVWEALFGK
jgi:hypothetical protein